MNHFRFESEDAAVKFGAAVDSAFGYPRKGKNHGSGVHAPEDLSVTSSFYGAPRKHPERDEWAFPFSDEVWALLQSSPEMGKEAVVEDLDASWFPIVPEATIPAPDPEAVKAAAAALVDRALGDLTIDEARAVLVEASARVEAIARGPEPSADESMSAEEEKANQAKAEADKATPAPAAAPEPAPEAKPAT